MIGGCASDMLFITLILHHDARDSMKVHYESREEPVQFLFDIVTNFFGFIIIEHGIFGVARAKDAAIGQFCEIGFDGQAADETIVWQLRTVDADVLLFLGNFINDDVGHLADFVTANAAFVGNGRGTQVRHAKKCEQGQPEFLVLSHRRHS